MFAKMSSYEKSGTYNSGVLDLSRPSHPRDSVETRRTPSPSNTSSFSSEGSPVNQQHHSYPLKVRNKFPNYLPKSPAPHDFYEHSRSPIDVTFRNSQVVTPPKIPTIAPVTALQNSIFTTQIKQRLSPSPHATPFIPYIPQLEHTYPPQSIVHPLKSNETISENLITTSSANSTTTTASFPLDTRGPLNNYLHDPLSIMSVTDSLLDTYSAEKYHNFRKRMLEQIRVANGGQQIVSNPKMRRTRARSVSSEDSSGAKNNNSLETNNNMTGSPFGIDADSKDPTYFERRKKNNLAAKKSRDKRRKKEDEITIKLAFLQRENIRLHIELSTAQNQLALLS